MRKTSTRPIAILDIETDPFLYGRIPKPFACEVYTLEWSKVFWGTNCIEEAFAFLCSVNQSYIIYAHNGGKFDWMYFLPFISGNLKIINGRIIQAKMGGHEIRDSYAILPFPLRDYQKDEIDYRKFEADVRESHKQEILDYLHGDCKYLYMLVSRFLAEFGQRFLTVGSAAMSQIKARHTVTRTKLAFDRVFRKDFFFGGRVQCFESGILEGEFSIYDVNSMYPDRMKHARHPIDAEYFIGDTVTEHTCFLEVSGISYGAFPVRNSDGGIEFPSFEGRFNCTRHEFDAAIACGAFVPRQIHTTFDFANQGSYAEFVDYGFNSIANAKACDDTAGAIGWKFVVVSGYGKFAQNPANFADWKIATLSQRPCEVCPHCKGSGECFFPQENGSCYQCRALNDFIDPDGLCVFCDGDGFRWRLHEYDSNNPDGPMLWTARTFAQSYYNVATGASITGAARAKLLHGISSADGPIYCDTDSVITRGSFRAACGPKLGEWKHEGTGQLAAIAGKKLYCIFSDVRPDFNDTVKRRKYPWMFESVRFKRKEWWPIKKAHKGMNLTPSDILDVAAGKEIERPSHAPAFSMTRNPYTVEVSKQARMFTKRTARRTALVA